MTYFGKGRTHDFKLFRRSGVRLAEHVELRADLGYWGLPNVVAQAIVPLKNSKLHPLTREQKRFNRALASRRVKVENVIRRLKVFRILSERYRHRRRRFGLRFNLLAGLHNYELKLQS